jgi:hypothetical protein
MQKAGNVNEKIYTTCNYCNLVQAGVDGGRTHCGPQRDPPPVLKTGEPTGTQPLPIKQHKHTLMKLLCQRNPRLASLHLLQRRLWILPEYEAVFDAEKVVFLPFYTNMEVDNLPILP